MSSINQTVVTMPYFDIPPRNIERFKEFCSRFIEATLREPKCLSYAFSFNGTRAHCRESYTDADGVLAHLDNIAPLNLQAMHLASIVRYEVHGPRAELEKLRAPLAFIRPEFYVIEFDIAHARACGRALVA